jgi:hypothetical protein
MSFPPHYRCEFTYDFRPVGQGLFCRGELRFTERGHERKKFQWVYDCGSESGASLRGEIDLYRRQLPEPKRLDLLVLSHFDNDHIKGVGRLLNGLPVDQLVLPYLTPAQRMVLVAFSGPDNLDYVRFLVSPAEYLANLPGAEIGAIIFIQPNEGTLPQEAEGVTEPPPPEDDRPSSIQFDAEKPSKREFGNDPGMFAQTASVKTGVQTSKGSRPMNLFGLWEFAFYNLPQPELAATLQPLVQPVFDAFYWQPSAQRNYDEFIRQIKSIYRRVFGADASGRNDISLVTYTGPIMRRLRSAHYLCRDRCQYPASRDARGPQAGNWEDATDGRISTLYTGDLTFRNGTTSAVRRFLGEDRWRRIRFLQVPHHGSQHSWELGQAANWNHEWSVFAAGLNNRHGHPHQPVIDDLRTRNPILVNEMNGAAWGGIAGWRKY